MMSRHSKIMGITILALFVAICQQGCREDEPADVAEKVEQSSPQATSRRTVPTVKKGEYANDMERLSKLTEKVNKACRRHNVVVLGGGGGGVIGVDYGVFDRLGDDGAAVMIAEAIIAASMPKPQFQGQTVDQSKVLHGDEVAGSYIAAAGFGPDGFNEWLDADELSPIEQNGRNVPRQLRAEAFMRGYLSVAKQN